MNKHIEVVQPSTLRDLDSNGLKNHIDDVLNGNLDGFVLNDSDSLYFQQSIDYAAELGLTGGINSTTMTFNYDSSINNLAPGEIPEPEDWEQFGITPLHVDGEEGEQMLSISKCSLGSYAICILNREQEILDQSPLELWDSLHYETIQILNNNTVDTDKLNNRMTRLNISLGQTVIFNPSRPHMGITTQSPRRVDTTFFHKES